MSWIGWCALDRVNAPRGLSIRAVSSAATSSLPGTGTALDRSETDRQQLAGVVALHRIDIGLAPGVLLVGGAKRPRFSAAEGHRRNAMSSPTPARPRPAPAMSRRSECRDRPPRDLVTAGGGRAV